MMNNEKKVAPKCPRCDEPITEVTTVFKYRPDVNVGLRWSEDGDYIEFSEIGENTRWHYEANCGHEVSDPTDFVGDEYAYDDRDYDPEDGYSEAFQAWAAKNGIRREQPPLTLGDVIHGTESETSGKFAWEK